MRLRIAISVVAFLALTAGLCAIDAASAQAQNQPWSDFEGRWRQGSENAESFSVGMLEIARCDDALCGRIVKDGACGPVVLRAKRAAREPDQTTEVFEGTFEWKGAIYETSLSRHNMQGDSLLVVEMIDSPKSIYMRSLVFGTSFYAAGPAQCRNSPTS